MSYELLKEKLIRCRDKKIKIEYANSETKAEESLINVVQKIYK